MSKRSLLVALCLGMTLGYFGYYKPASEQKEIMREAQGSDVPEVVVLATADVSGIQTKTFYVKSTNKVCTIAPSAHVMQTPIACEEAKVGVHRKVLQIVAAQSKL